MVKLYEYVGPPEIKERARQSPPGILLGSADDLRRWMHSTGQQPDASGFIVVTFVIDQMGRLRVSDRSSEHIACSGLQPVLSAGEMFLREGGDGFEVIEVTNQSTGFCPEPSSWSVVATALDELGIPRPHRFTSEVRFRRCLTCGERNVVKDNWFVCAVCGADLPAHWNF